MDKLKKKTIISPAETLRAMNVGQVMTIKNTDISSATLTATISRLNKTTELKYTAITRGQKGLAVIVTRIN